MGRRSASLPRAGEGAPIGRVRSNSAPPTPQPKPVESGERKANKFAKKKNGKLLPNVTLRKVLVLPAAAEADESDDEGRGAPVGLLRSISAPPPKSFEIEAEASEDDGSGSPIVLLRSISAPPPLSFAIEKIEHNKFAKSANGKLLPNVTLRSRGMAELLLEDDFDFTDDIEVARQSSGSYFGDQEEPDYGAPMGRLRSNSAPPPPIRRLGEQGSKKKSVVKKKAKKRATVKNVAAPNT